MSTEKPIYISWCAREALDGMQQLNPVEELAYRRILDLIYSSGDFLLDDDSVLAWATKAEKKWPKVKEKLLLLGKIEQIDGRISQKKCREKIAEAMKLINQRKIAGEASAESRKALKNNNRGSTAVDSSLPTGQQQPYQRQEDGRTNKIVNSKYNKNNPLRGGLQKDDADAPPPPPKQENLDQGKGTKMTMEFVPSDGWRDYARLQGLDDQEIKTQFLLFRDHHIAGGKAADDWGAAWRNWIRREIAFKAKGNN